MLSDPQLSHMVLSHVDNKRPFTTAFILAVRTQLVAENGSSKTLVDEVPVEDDALIVGADAVTTLIAA